MVWHALPLADPLHIWAVATGCLAALALVSLRVGYRDRRLFAALLLTAATAGSAVAHSVTTTAQSATGPVALLALLPLSTLALAVGYLLGARRSDRSGSRMERAESQRAAAEVIGTVLIISLTIAGAIVVVTLAGSAMQALGDETQNSLATDSFHEMDDRLAGVIESDVDASTTFSFPEGSGSAVTAMPEEGRVNVTVRLADNDHQDLVVADDTSNSTEFTIGTVVYEDTEGTELVYQGGGVWEFPSKSHANLRSNPPFDYDGEWVNFQFVNVSNLEVVNEGQEYAAVKDTQKSRQLSENLRERLSPYWRVEGEGDFTVPVEVNVTIESEYALGWKVYAEEQMGEALGEDEIVYRPNDGTPHKPNVTLVFGATGGSDLPDYPDPIVVADSAVNAPATYDRTANATLNSTGLNQFRIENGSGTVDESQQLAFYEESEERWLIHWDNQTGSKAPPDDQTGGDTNSWYNVSASVQDPLGASVYANSADPPQIADYNFSEDGYHEYQFADAHADVPVCVIAYDDDADFPANGTLDSLEECAANLDVKSPGNFMPTDLQINFTHHVNDSVLDESEDVRVNVTNVGSFASTQGHDVGLYREEGGDLSLVDFNTSDSIGTIKPGNSTEFNLTWNPRSTSTDSLHAIVGAHDTDTEDVTVSGRDINATVAIADDTNETIGVGSQLAVDATVNNTGNAVLSGVNVVLLDEGSPVDTESVDVGVGEETNVSLEWNAPVDSFNRTLEVQVLGSNDTHIVESDGTPHFNVADVSIENGPAEAGQPLDVKVDLENTGDANGTQDIVLIADTEQTDELLADTTTRFIQEGDSKDITMTWDSPVDPRRGDNEVIVRTRDDTESKSFDVGPKYTVQIDDVEIDEEMESEPGNVVNKSDLTSQVEVDATITNLGDVEGDQEIELEVPGASDLKLTGPGDNKKDLDVDGGASEGVTLERTIHQNAITGNLSVSSADDSENSRVIVRRPSGPDCSSVTIPGSGTTSNPYEISSVDHLQCLDQHSENNKDENSQYVLTEDIDAYGTPYWNGGDGFEPIGEQDRGADDGWFAGDVDGQQYSIEGLTIDRIDEGIVGIFAVTDSFDNDGVGTGVTIENIILEDIYVRGKSNVGGLVGGGGGSIERISVDGYVEAKYQEVGGIVGTGHDTDLDNKLVSTATVKGGYPAKLDGEHPWGANSVGIGGIVGATGFNTDIATAYSRATVKGQSAVGGITGWTSDFDSTNEQMYWANGTVEFIGERRLHEMGSRSNLTDPPKPGAIAGRMELDDDNFKNSVYADKNYRAVGEQKADADAVPRDPEKMVGPQVLPDSEASNYPGITTNDTEGTMKNLDWSIWEPVYEINETGGIVNESFPVFDWEVEGGFVVDNVSAPENVTEGETVTVNATIANTKSATDTQDVRLFSPRGIPVDINETTLDPNDSKTVRFNWTTRVNDNTTDLDDPTVTVQTEDTGNTDPMNIRRLELPEFQVDTINSVTGNTEEGGYVDVNFTLENTGGTGNQTVFLENDTGRILNSTVVEVEEGEMHNMTLTWYPQIGDNGDETLRVKTPHDDEETDVDIDSADFADFEIDSVSFPAHAGTPVVTAGESLTAQVTISNTGNASGEDFVWLTPGNESDILSHNMTGEVDDGDSATFNLTWTRARSDVESLGVHVNDETERHSVVVQGTLESPVTEPIDVALDMIRVDA